MRTQEDLADVEAVIIPGGESTTIGMLMDRFGLLAALKHRIDAGLPAFGTCAGAILLATDIEGSNQVRIGTLSIGVRRNAYGRQDESFEAPITLRTDHPILSVGDSPIGVFIRAPIITDARATTVLACREKHPVLVQSGSTLAATFHPELTGDDRIHRYFLQCVAKL